MLLDFYGLKEQPFGVTPDPRFLYPTRTHLKAFHSLSRGIGAGCGFLALIAGPGMGKTTLLFQLSKQFEQTLRPVFLFQTMCDSLEFWRYLLTGLGLDATRQNLVSMHQRLNQLLAREVLAGRRVALIVDECQNLDNSVLETIRLLSNFETPRAKMMQIILTGQPQLAEKLSSPNLAQLRQRISILSRLEPLSREEIFGYVEHRLRVAGHVGAPLFTSDALERISARSEGIPRIINNLCFNALLLGFEAGRKQIESAIVDKVLADLDANPLKPESTIPKQGPPSLQRTPIILELGDSEDAPPDLVSQVGQPQAPVLATKPPLPCAAVASRDYSDVKQVDVSNEHEAIPDSLVRKPQVVRPLTPPQKAQSGPSPAGRDFSGQRQVSSTTMGQVAAHPNATSASQKTSEAAPLKTPAQPHMAAISYPEMSTGPLQRNTLGALALGAILLLTGFVLFYMAAVGRRQLLEPLGAAGAPVVDPLASPPVSSAPATSSTLVPSLPTTDAAPAQSILAGILEGKIVRIVIDPGHGGHDTGTTGPTGLMEKNLCLDIARRLGQIIKQRLPNTEIIFTRTNDSFIPLEERTYIANNIKADLFLSIHANSSPHPADRGIETYYLDSVGSNEVMEVAARENATAQEKVSDRVERMKKNGFAEKMEESRMFAENIQDSLSRFIQHSTSAAHNRGVHRAPFVVLAGAHMPSVLTEISFLSNPWDEQLLREVEYRDRLADSLYQGVASYLQSLKRLTYNSPATNPVVVPSDLSSVPTATSAADRAPSQP